MCLTCECTMTRMYLQYLIIFLKSFSMLFFPNVSDHFLLALVNAFFLLLYLNSFFLYRRNDVVLVFYSHPSRVYGYRDKEQTLSSKQKCSAAANPVNQQCIVPVWEENECSRCVLPLVCTHFSTFQRKFRAHQELTQLSKIALSMWSKSFCYGGSYSKIFFILFRIIMKWGWRNVKHLMRLNEKNYQFL